jgi:hypothetical protein
MAATVPAAVPINFFTQIQSLLNSCQFDANETNKIINGEHFTHPYQLIMTNNEVKTLVKLMKGRTAQ